MRIFRVLTLSLVLGVALIPQAAFAAQASFFGPIISEQCQCETTAPDWGCVMQAIQNSVNLAVSLSVIIAVLIIAYAGILWMTSPLNAHNREQGRTILLNAVIGLLIALSAWLVIDFLMKALYNEDSGFGPWNTIISGEGRMCLLQTSQGTIDTTVTETDVATGPADDRWDYDGGIDAQYAHASGPLKALLNCMVEKVPGNVGRISSISDGMITAGQRTFAQCAAGQCRHASNSCHYGGRTCVGSSYAVDFGDGDSSQPSHLSALKAAATACNADFVNPEATHLHVSVGASCGCDSSD